MTTVEEIRERVTACPIPMDAQADWDGTNHYEVQTCSADGYWWFVGGCVLADSSTESGKRLGAIFEAAVAYKRDVTALLKEIARLTV